MPEYPTYPTEKELEEMYDEFVKEQCRRYDALVADIDTVADYPVDYEFELPA